MDDPTEQYDTVSDLAERWRVDHRTVRDLIDRGELVAVRIGRQFRISPSDLECFLERQRTSSGAA